VYPLPDQLSAELSRLIANAMRKDIVGKDLRSQSLAIAGRNRRIVHGITSLRANHHVPVLEPSGDARAQLRG
jgi:hypothetical protein